MTKSTNSTAAEFAAMLAEVKVAERVCSNSRGRRRRPQASVYLAHSKRSSPPALLTPASWVRSSGSWSPNRWWMPDARGAVDHIAQQLEGMAGGVVLSADAAAQIRAGASS
jgi:hypothetical protein